MEWPISWNDVKTKIEALERVAFPNLYDNVIKIGPMNQYMSYENDSYWVDGSVYGYYKVSDRVLTQSELKQCTLYVSIDNSPDMSVELKVDEVSEGNDGIFIAKASVIGAAGEYTNYLIDAIFVSNDSEVPSGTYVQLEYVLGWYEGAFGAPGATFTGMEIRLNTEA